MKDIKRRIEAEKARIIRALNMITDADNSRQMGMGVVELEASTEQLKRLEDHWFTKENFTAHGVLITPLVKGTDKRLRFYIAEETYKKICDSRIGIVRSTLTGKKYRISPEPKTEFGLQAEELRGDEEKEI